MAGYIVWFRATVSVAEARDRFEAEAKAWEELEAEVNRAGLAGVQIEVEDVQRD